MTLYRKMNFLILPDLLQTFHDEEELNLKHSLTSSPRVRDAALSCCSSHNQQVFLQAEQAYSSLHHPPSSMLLHFICNTLWYLLCLWHPATRFSVLSQTHYTKMRNYLFSVNGGVGWGLSLKNISTGTLFLTV